MNKYLTTLLLCGLLCGGYLLSTLVSAADENQDSSQSISSGGPDDSLDMSSPGSVEDRLEEDAKPKNYVFQFPGFSEGLQPWNDAKANLAEKPGFRYGVS